ncbi:peptidase M24, structural domain-containing protein [Syncephalastrum racemosum]|uniref:Peptidase M24, structural domain-containing protein n=1 Tax=Syncephalastrum racemosum TaxID=13706 RepID=A0A1X2HIT4_SYNRA|nr:peptidase M24, structural domain-containing protein [Syncephalastrum racemosum]
MATPDEIAPILPSQQNPKGQASRRWGKVNNKTMCMRVIVVFSLLLGLAGGVWVLQLVFQQTNPEFGGLHGYCSKIQPIQPIEYSDRLHRLAATLDEGEAYVMEPGPTLTYYTNIAWSLSERPFVVILRKDTRQPTGIHTTIVTPLFEATRAEEALHDAALPSDIDVKIVSWIEHASPYEIIAEQLPDVRTVYVEQNIRLFIYTGMEQAGLPVQVASRALQTLRMVKSPAEIAILRCVNHVTELAIRKVRPHVIPGMTEADIATLMERALHQAGLTNTWVLALVDENAAFPHGEPGATKRVTPTSTVLIDTGGEFLGYQSDTTRTFFLGDSKHHNQTIVDAWYTVRKAQEQVLTHVEAGISCADVDLTARKVIDDAGLGAYFTHRLGHGIGEEMHEEPYMNRGNIDLSLKPGMTFSVEPGVYVAKEFGIRLEDIVMVNEEGRLELLTSGLAANPWTL